MFLITSLRRTSNQESLTSTLTLTTTVLKLIGSFMLFHILFGYPLMSMTNLGNSKLCWALNLSINLGNINVCDPKRVEQDDQNNPVQFQFDYQRPKELQQAKIIPLPAEALQR